MPLVYSNLLAQGNPADEVKIKTSGEFIWEQLAGVKEAELKSILAEAIWSKEATKELRKTNPTLSKSAIQYIVKPRGPKFMVIAYLDKNITAHEAKIEPIKEDVNKEQLRPPNKSPNELEVKTSGNYIWDQLAGSDEAKIKESLYEILWNNNEVQSLRQANPRLTKNDIAFIVKPRGTNFLIIAYVSRDQLASKTTSASVSAIKQAEKPRQENREIALSNSNESQKEPTSYPQNASPINEPKPKVSTEEKQSAITQSQKENKEEIITDKKENPYKSSNVYTAVDRSAHTKLFQNIALQNKCLEVMPLLEQDKKQGKVYYDTRTDVFDKGIESCYIMVCDTQTGSLTYLLSPGGKVRANLKNGENVSVAEIQNKSNLNTLYIYEIN